MTELELEAMIQRAAEAGANFQGELGRTNLAYSSSPIQVGSETNWDFATSTQDEGSSFFKTLG